ncbi:UPF0725 protein At4g29550 [Eutrema salsugineum]|uniref:UPF0725 protein At4g29550 n=1 Tax=Eutrema salsugineum TaxID=72664 RepID=UPI000CED4BB0|nr:UPF0725 protein At4g29550 [Eutrema salsugineum]
MSTCGYNSEEEGDVDDSLKGDMDDSFKGDLPDRLPQDWLTASTNKLQYYEMEESEMEEDDKEMLRLYAHLALNSECHGYGFPKPIELGKVIVQTRQVVESEKKMVLKAGNAIFYISFKNRSGNVLNGIIRKTKCAGFIFDAKCVSRFM